VSTIFASALKTVPEAHYRPREPNVIQRLFRERFYAFEAAYSERYTASCGKYRLPLIQRAAEALNLCGDWHEGIARVHCPDCGYDLFVPFSCKSFFLCPSCGQKRTLLWKDRPVLRTRAAEQWCGLDDSPASEQADAGETVEIGTKASRKV
jgi:hypothetical protein